MDQFSYLSVLLSIILGLAITQVLKGFRGVLLARRRVLMYWPVVAWAVSLLGIDVQSWWAIYGLRAVSQWSFLEFSVVLLQTVIQYMLAALVFPDFLGGETTDLREHYREHTGWFFGLMVALLVTSLAKNVAINGGLPAPVDVGFHALFIAASAIAAFTHNERYHKANAVFALALFAVYTLALFSRLR